MENLTILIVFSGGEALSTGRPIAAIAFHTKGFSGMEWGVENYAGFVKSAAEAHAVLHHS
ncbi:hypothetical protein [Stenotrophomonas sp.]|uniref:hypothetical protein n=1 Tax=Stenotrophomonas sp. TaxID=69392 RepID=UPI002FC87C0F